jgi:hypothetical protein
MTPEERDAINAKNEEIVRAYHVCFSSPSGQLALTDLVGFCRMMETIYAIGDPYSTALLEGRRQVFLRIAQFAKLTEEEILQLRLGRINPKPGD